MVGVVKAMWLMNELSIQKSWFVGVNEFGKYLQQGCPWGSINQCSYLRHELQGHKWLSK